MHRRNYTEITEEDMQWTIEKEKVDFEYDTKFIEKTINLLDDILAAYTTAICLKGMIKSKLAQISMAIIRKNIDYLYSTFLLTRQGMYGSARVIFRNIYESLIILKTVAIANDEQLLQKWINGEEISLRSSVFRKIEYPISEEMKVLWNDLCRFCHGTIYSIEQEKNYSEAKGNIEYNYVIIEMLVYMNFHVLNRYVFSEGMKAMIYRTVVSDVPIKDKITQMRLLMKSLKEVLCPAPKRVLIDFSKVWKFK